MNRAYITVVGSAVDTVGAGDCFCGALAVTLAEGRSLDTTVRFASCAAALAVQQHGAHAALPGREAISEFMTDNQPNE
jgi:ribokinase